MLTPAPGQIRLSNGSSKKALFDCSCGRTGVLKTWKYYISGHTTTCGMCGVLDAKHWETTSYGKLRMKDPINIHRGSNKTVEFICECGNITRPSVIDVTSGNTRSCGKCSVLSSSHFELTKYGHLRMKLPIDTYPMSSKDVEWVCDCGGEIVSKISNVVRGLTKSCGRCTVLPTSHFVQTKFGKLTMKFPDSYHPSSSKFVEWICDCGGCLITSVHSVISGDTKSCGKCTVLSTGYWTDSKFGLLHMKNPVPLKHGSHQKTTWVCDCGGEIDSHVFNVTRLSTTKCGNCYNRIRAIYEANESEIRSLKVPISPDQLPAGFLSPKEIITNAGRPFLAVCALCGHEYTPTWDNVRTGGSLTCGCSSNRVSNAHCQINDYIKSLGVNTVTEHSVNNLKYDIFVPARNLLIEYQGLHWHSGETSSIRDLKKYKNAIHNNFDFISIFEDEWLYSRHKIEQLLRNRLIQGCPTSVRPGSCEIRVLDSHKSNLFYEQYHYIGKCRSSVNYGVFYQDELIGCVSFGHPTRQSSHPWELVRMTGHPGFRVHGIWSKLIKRFIHEYNPSSIVSFSDNRLFQGGVYEKIGFRLDGEIPPDYYWVKGQKRFHKSGLRKTDEEKLTGRTETELRESQGFKKIWDLGKKRWVVMDF